MIVVHKRKNIKNKSQNKKYEEQQKEEEDKLKEILGSKHTSFLYMTFCFNYYSYVQLKAQKVYIGLCFLYRLIMLPLFPIFV